MARDIRPAGNIVGSKVRRLRNARGWSQPELAARCQRMGWDVGRDIIARIESQVRPCDGFRNFVFSKGSWCLRSRAFPHPEATVNDEPVSKVAGHRWRTALTFRPQKFRAIGADNQYLARTATSDSGHRC
jgi:hypothetical protein